MNLDGFDTSLLQGDTPTESFRRDRVALAIQTLERIPGGKIDLDYYYFQLDTAHNHCGTIACGAGWLALQPEWNALGLRVDPDSKTVVTDHRDGAGAMGKMFYSANYNWQKDVHIDVLFGGRNATDADKLLEDRLQAYFGAEQWVTWPAQHAALLLARLQYCLANHCGA